VKSELENYKHIYTTHTDEDRELISFLPKVVGIYELEQEDAVEETEEPQDIMTRKYINPLDDKLKTKKYV